MAQERQCTICTTDDSREAVEAIGCKCQGTMGMHPSCRIAMIKHQADQNVRNRPLDDTDVFVDHCKVCNELYSVKAVRESAFCVYWHLLRNNNLVRPLVGFVCWSLFLMPIFTSARMLVVYLTSGDDDTNGWPESIVSVIIEDLIRASVFGVALGHKPWATTVQVNVIFCISVLGASAAEHWFCSDRLAAFSMRSLWSIFKHWGVFAVAMFATSIVAVQLNLAHKEMIARHGRIQSFQSTNLPQEFKR